MRSRKPFWLLTCSGTWMMTPSSLMLVVLLPPPSQAVCCSCRRLVSSGQLGGQELPRGLRRAAVAEHHLGVQLPYRCGGQVAADSVEGLGEGRALLLEHRLIDDRREVLEAEEVLRVAQHHVRGLRVAQLRVGGEHVSHLDLPAVQRREDR